MAARRSRRLDDDEGPSPEDIDAFGDATRPCPNCGATLHDDVELCWKCGHALGGRASATDGKPVPIWVWIVVGLVVIGILAPWVLRIV